MGAMTDAILVNVLVFVVIGCLELGLNLRFMSWLGKQIERPWLVLPVLFCLILFLFWKILDPDYVLFSNDGPLGTLVASQTRIPSAAFSLWGDMNWIGGPELSYGFFLASERSVVAVPECTIFIALLTCLLSFRFLAKKQWRKVYGVWCLVSAATISVTSVMLLTGKLDPSENNLLLAMIPTCGFWFIPQIIIGLIIMKNE